jgi:hypothetical protein
LAVVTVQVAVPLVLNELGVHDKPLTRGRGVTVTLDAIEVPLNDAVIDTGVDAVTVPAVTVKVVIEVLIAAGDDAGTGRAVLLLLVRATALAALTVPERSTVHVAEAPEGIVEGLHATLLMPTVG